MEFFVCESHLHLAGFVLNFTCQQNSGGTVVNHQVEQKQRHGPNPPLKDIHVIFVTSILNKYSQQNKQ